MDGDGVAVGQTIGSDVLGLESLGAAVVHGRGEGAGFGVDGEDAPPLAGHQLAPCSWGQGDDAVAGGVVGVQPR